MIKLTPQDVVLFQGDSITDGNHGRTEDPNHILGHGFACMVSSRLGLENLEAHPTFINRGESGDGILQLHARWRKDAILLKPTIINILVGINNCGLSIPYDENGHGMPAHRFAEGYTSCFPLAYCNGSCCACGEQFEDGNGSFKSKGSL